MCIRDRYQRRVHGDCIDRRMDTNIRLFDAPASTQGYVPPAASMSGDSAISFTPEVKVAGFPIFAPNPSPAPAPAPVTEGKSSIPICGLFTLDYYKPYFNVTTLDVLERIKQPFIPNKARFFSTIQGRPDFYGPFWIYTLLIFVIVVASNINNYVNTTNKTYSFEFSCIGLASTIVYSFGFVFPLILNFIMNMFESKTRYADILCIYGYSTVVFIPAALLAGSGFGLVAWLLLLYAAGNSSLFLMTNLWTELEKYILNKRYIIMGLIGTSQLLLMMIMKVRFF
eukprot:TRINITY_DN2283_c0_g1_i1.p1 TRINITY_DN2283_c0_g1~~TRINITY_DN2283_c0_g1_i1.p1  ORF type:complete len:283 (-),score=68.49 TRINITY_DN2283_c0_g1_i1:145-993(-)